MLLFGLLSSPLQFIIYIGVILFALTIHEFAHAYVSDKLGDPTARHMGRISLNPFAHLDPFGTLFLLLAGFGWGKPVMVNPENFANPKLDNLTVSLAGPVTNFIAAVILGLILRFANLPIIAVNILSIAILLNLVLMTFNLLPIPPLDGSKVLALFVPEDLYNVLQQYGTFILLFLILFSSSIPFIPFILNRVVGFLYTLITGQSIMF